MGIIKKSGKSYAMIYFNDRKPLKKYYDTCMKAFYDYESQGCISVELFDYRGIKLSSYKKPVE